MLLLLNLLFFYLINGKTTGLWGKKKNININCFSKKGVFKKGVFPSSKGFDGNLRQNKLPTLYHATKVDLT